MGYNLNKTVRWTFFTTGAILIILGVLSIIYPFVVLLTTAVFMGVGFLLSGLNNLIPYFSMRDNPLRPQWLLPLGIVDVIFGLFFLSHIGLAVFALTTLLGVWVLLTGCLRAYISFKIKAAGAQKWWMMLLSAAAMLALSAALLANPGVEGVLLALLAGLSLMIAGAAVIAEGKLIYPASRNI
jgi:uncharacterized membrane protein HdeD (DUF308 family)